MNHMLLIQSAFVGHARGEAFTLSLEEDPPDVLSDDPYADFERARAEALRVFTRMITRDFDGDILGSREAAAASPSESFTSSTSSTSFTSSTSTPPAAASSPKSSTPSASSTSLTSSLAPPVTHQIHMKSFLSFPRIMD